MTSSPDDLGARFAVTAFGHPFRPYQQLALEAFERARAGGDDRIYLTMPPGSGKTAMGLEVARRIGNPVVVLAPTSAIVAQWLTEWASFTPATVAASTSADLAEPVTVLTYLEGASHEVSAEFADALGELVAPLWDPRWIIGRHVEPAPAGLAQTAALVARRLTHDQEAPVVWHAIPAVLARRKDRVAAFEAAWRHFVDPAAGALPASDPRAQAVLAARAGDDPFLTETQLRTLWT